MARYLLAAYLAMVVYASLYPFSGWKVQGVSAFAFLASGLPRYLTAFDVAVNALVYVPLGFLLAVAFFPRIAGVAAAALAAIAAGVVSLALESLQSFLPTRIASNVDLALNFAGGLLGAIAGALLAPRYVASGPVRAWRARWFPPGKHADLGLVVIALWLLTQLDPETLLFGNGDLRDLFAAVPAQLYPPALFVRVEALISAANVIGIALFAGALVAPGRAAWLFVAMLIGAALAVRSIAFAVLFEPQGAFGWITRGALVGLVVGLAGAWLLGQTKRPVRIALAGVFIMAATVLVNVAPGNPYLASALATWRQGHFLNFNGLTSAASALWPFLAIAYLLAYGLRQAR